MILLGAILILSSVALGQTTQEQTNELRPGLVPGNPLYAIEGFVENLEVKIAGVIGGPEMKSKAIANNAEERLAEAKYLADNNKTDQAGKAVKKYLEGVNQSRDIAQQTGNTNLSEKLQNLSNRNQQALEEVEKKVPPQAQEAIKKAQEKSSREAQRRGKKSQNNSALPDNGKKGNLPDKTNGQVNKSNISKPEAGNGKNSSLSKKSNLRDNTGQVSDNKSKNKTINSQNKTSGNRGAVENVPQNNDDGNYSDSDRELNSSGSVEQNLIR